MNLFSTMLVAKEEGSNFLYYDSSKGKTDKHIHGPILKKGMSPAMLDMSMSRLRVRTGVSMEDAKILLGV